MSSRTWWKSSSRDFMPSRYTAVGKAVVRGPGGSAKGGPDPWGCCQPAHSRAGRLLGQEEADPQS